MSKGVKRVLVTGGSGFVGRAVVEDLYRAGYEVTVYSRDVARTKALWPGHIHVVERLEDAFRSEAGFILVVNLAGEAIAKARWTDARKQVLWQSRVDTTEKLVSLCRDHIQGPFHFIQASAVGFYGAQLAGPWPVLDETSPAGDDFLAQLCVAWEAPVWSLLQEQAQVSILRLAPVFDREGGRLAVPA